MPETAKIEFLLAHDDRTWSTEILDVPVGPVDPVQWFNEGPLMTRPYADVVMAMVYNDMPEEEVE